jgi:signal transduction histidine kinase
MRRRHVKQYAVSVLLVLAAVLVEFALRPLFHDRAPLTFFFVATALAAAYGGLGPGIAATGLSLICIESLFSDSIFSLLTGQPSVWLFGLIGIGVSVVIEGFQRRNRSLARAKQLLESANRELARRSDDLVRSNGELKRFAYAVSHDLRSPLRAVGLATELLAEKVDGKLDRDAEELMQFVIAGARRANEMVCGLLEYSVAAHKNGAAAAANLNSVLAAALEDVQTAVGESGARVTSEQLPIVQGDAVRLRQVFLNLLTNAIKYRSERLPEIHIAARRSGNEWIVSVSDNGIGVDPRYSEKIFGLFERLHDSDRYEGTGIGLAICRAVVEGHCGRIWVESEPGRGSTFYFTLPQHQTGPQ